MNTDFRLPDGTVVAGDYRIVRLIAEGGMGAVYLCEQVSTARLRAFKVLHPRFVREPLMREKFMQEARVASRIASDHVVEVVSAGVEEQSGIPWMVMEYLQGDTLDVAVKKSGRLSHEDTREVFAQLGHAISAAHAVGIVHRDLKPENVILARSNRMNTPFIVKVLDFGIAKIVQDSYAGNTQTMGTPLWMAPEQTVAGERIGTATDVWAMGLLAFYVLTGKLYWRSANSPDGGAMSVLRELMIDPIEPASTRAAQLGGPDAMGALPPGFDPWFARCVDRDISMRFRLAGEASSSLLELFRAATGLAPTAAMPVFTPTPRSTALPVTTAAPAWVNPGPSAPVTPWQAPMAQSSNGPKLQWPKAPMAQVPHLGNVPWQAGSGISVASAPRSKRRVPVAAIAAVALFLALASASATVLLLRDDPEPHAPAPAHTHLPSRLPLPPPRVPVVAPPRAPLGPSAVMTPIEAPAPTPALPEHPDSQSPEVGNPFANHPIWRGRYQCSQGFTNAVLNIQATRGDLVVGRFAFNAPQSSISGEYFVVGRWEESTRRLVLRPRRWVVHPAGWQSVGLDGRVSQDNGTYAGQMLNPNCGQFSLQAAR